MASSSEAAAGLRRPAYIDAEGLRGLLDVRMAVDALAAGFRAPLPEAPARQHLAVDGGDLLLMPAYGAHGAGVKLVTLAAGNARRGMPLIHGVFALFAPETLELVAVLDGAAPTALRTAAVTALATDLLARPDAERLVIFGAGRQAHAHLEAMCAVRPVRSVDVVEPDATRADALVRAARARGLDARRADADAVRRADLVCACTTSAVPVVDGLLVADGAHVNAMGAFRPTDRELDTALMRRGRVVVETRDAALAEAGELAIPIERGELDADVIRADLAELVGGRQVRRDPDDVTVFKSVGVAFEDLVVAIAAWRRLARHSLEDAP